MDDWKKDLSVSAKVFTDQIAPIFLDIYGGKLLHMETAQDSNFARILDMSSGIDAWHICEGRIRGIANRVQWGELNSYYPYNTFTIRKQRDSGSKTEYAKRKEAIESGYGWIYPYLTIQAYTDNDQQLLCFAVAKTKRIFQAIDNGECTIKRTNNASFYIVEWSLDLCEILYSNCKLITNKKLPLLAEESGKSAGWLSGKIECNIKLNKIDLICFLRYGKFAQLDWSQPNPVLAQKLNLLPGQIAEIKSQL